MFRTFGRVNFTRRCSFNAHKVFMSNNNRKENITRWGLSDKQVEDVISPWWNIPYNDQLTKKKQVVEETLSKLGKKVIKDNSKYKIPWIESLASRSLEKGDYLPLCPIEDIVPSPEVEGYRNKSILSFGKDVTERPAIGFVMGNFSDGITHIANPAGSVNSTIHPVALHLRDIVEDFVKKSTLPVYDKVINHGFWRTLELRTYESGENMMIIGVNTSRYSRSVCSYIFCSIIN